MKFNFKYEVIGADLIQLTKVLNSFQVIPRFQ